MWNNPGYEHHSQADTFKDFSNETRSKKTSQHLTKSQHFIEYRWVNGKWQARMTHFQTPQ